MILKNSHEESDSFFDKLKAKRIKTQTLDES